MVPLKDGRGRSSDSFLPTFLTFEFFVSANSNLLKLRELFDIHQDQVIRKAIMTL